MTRFVPIIALASLALGPCHDRVVASEPEGVAVASELAEAAEYEAPFVISDGDRNFWAFRPPALPARPAVRDTTWPRSAVDHFLLAALEAKNLRPAPPADKRTLIRRATFDLHGLPPSVDEVETFVADTSSDAFAKVVDRLLASPRYGERWGRRWLDLARYADSNGMDENMAMAHAWRYRDWVIGALNRDLPYDQFVRDQIAGDLLPAADEATRFERLIATGFLVLGPKMLAEDDPVKMEMDIIDEQVDTIGRTFMGLSLGCARCHDHKFDPISAADYYALAGIFKSTKTMENYRVVAMWSERPLAAGERLAELKRHESRVAQLNDELKAIESIASAGAERGDDSPTADAEQQQAALAGLKQQLADLEKTAPQVPHVLAVADRDVQNLRVHLRGSHLTLGAEVPRQFPRVLAGDAQQPISAQSSGRLELARWLTRPDHPLTSRVMVNRIWQGHFGEGLVRSCDNFGKLGQRPDHPELLDWLARQFVASDWSIKAMHRLIMLSSAYQMSTAYDARAAEFDPENRLLWRVNRRRLEAEEIRDAILAASGALDLTMGGTQLTNKNHTYVTSTASVDDVRYDNPRRSIYLPVVRSAVYDVLQAFDFADPSTAIGKRPSTTVAPQALFMMNSSLVQRHSRAMAESLLAIPADDAARVGAAYLRAYSRPATANETARALQFVAEYCKRLNAENVPEAEIDSRAWQALCRVILSSNEFVYLE